MSTPVDVAGLEELVDHSLITGDESGLEILGYGEISCVVAWRDGDFALAGKRLPLFADIGAVDAYGSAFHSYLARLEEAGLRVAPSRLETVSKNDGRIAVWCVQPLMEKGSIAPAWLSGADDEAARWLVTGIIDHVVGTVTPSLGLDGQLSNWAIHDDHLVYFDVTTPMMRDDSCREILDVELFLTSLPWALRGLVRRFLLRSILDKYYEPRGVVLDLLGNLIKEGAADRLDIGLAAANSCVRPAIDADEVHRYYREDARMWELLQRLRRLDRWWQRRVRKRQYPFLLPGKVVRNV